MKFIEFWKLFRISRNSEIPAWGSVWKEWYENENMESESSKKLKCCIEDTCRKIEVSRARCSSMLCCSLAFITLWTTFLSMQRYSFAFFVFGDAFTGVSHFRFPPPWPEFLLLYHFVSSARALKGIRRRRKETSALNTSRGKHAHTLDLNFRNAAQRNSS